MPELPEVEITARLLGAALVGAEVESTLAPGVNALKSFDPPLAALDGSTVTGVRRRGKLFLLDFSPELTALVHLMSAGRLQLFETRASLRDKSSRWLVRLAGGRELRLREFGTRQRAWVKLVHTGQAQEDPAIAELGPEAWPDPPPLRELLSQPRPLYTLLRDQHVIAGIGRSWADEILHDAMLSPFKRGNDLDDAEAERLRAAMLDRLGHAIDTYEAELSLPLPDKLPLPLRVHRHNGEPCWRCGDGIEAVFYEDYIMCYCPTCQTEGKLLKDRRLSRLLK